MSLNISSAGDIMLGENVHHYRRGVASRYLGRFPDLLAPKVAEVINGSDLFFGNFECSLLPDAEWDTAGLERSMYAAPESALDFFKEWKPEIILNVANNHFGQHGKETADYTIECLVRIGIRCIGRDRNPAVLLKGDRRVVAWGVTLVKDRYLDAGYFKTTADTVMDELGWIEKQADDYWVVSIHWGEEYLTQPSTVQEELADKLVAKGVDLILGHHPHVVQPVLRHGNAVVAFSHGNFIFDQNFSRLTQTGLLLSTQVGLPGIRPYRIMMRNYRVISAQEMTVEQLAAYCRKSILPVTPFLMRIKMKLELVFHAWEVPRAVWVYFGSRLMRRG